MRKIKISERGQNIALFAMTIPLMSIFILGILDYMITTSRVMAAIAAADLAAHAGAQEVKVQPNGAIVIDDAASGVAADYFRMQQTSFMNLTAVACGMVDERPSCSVQVKVRAANILIHKGDVTVNARGYLVYGVTRPDQ